MSNVYHPFQLCPHCLKRDVMFKFIHSLKVTDKTHNTLWVCQNCQLGLGAVITTAQGKTFDIIDRLPHHDLIKFKADWSFDKIYPEPKSLDAPAHTPENVNYFYRQGLRSFLAKDYDACGMMMRKVLDVATKDIAGNGGSLYTRIEAMSAKGDITPTLAAWAHEIRDIGNEAAHDEAPFSETDARNITNFTELFLMYIFTLPGMLAARRQVSPS